MDTTAAERVRRGRPVKHTDEHILEAIESGCDTADKLLATLDLKSKSTLMIRLRRMRAAGLVRIIERARSEGFTIISERRVV